METTKLKEENNVATNVNLKKEKAEADAIVQDAFNRTHRFLLFELEKEQYGIDISYVLEIIGIQEITYLPGMPRFVKGLINLRGKIIPVIVAREKFNKQKAIYNDRTCIIVLELEGIMVGLVVDMISDVITVSESILEEAPKIGKIKTNKYISNIAKMSDGVKLLVDCEKLINE